MGVTVTWRWEDANRVIQTDPRVKCLKTISDKKAAFNEFINDIKTREKAEAKERRQIVSISCFWVVAYL